MTIAVYHGREATTTITTTHTHTPKNTWVLHGFTGSYAECALYTNVEEKPDE